MGKHSSGDETRAKNSKSDLFADSIIGELSGVFVRALFIGFFLVWQTPAECLLGNYFSGK